MQLSVQNREKLGKAVKAIRKEGMVPAELYGHGLKNQHLTVDAKEFKKVYKEAGANTVITLLVGGKEHKALIHRVERDPLGEMVNHIDFYEVRMDEVLTARVPVVFTGEAPAVKTLGGILNRTMNEIEVEALPADLPHSFSIDLSGLTEINQSIYVKDLAIPKGVKIEVDPETVIVSVSPPMKEEEVVVAAPSVTDVKVETEEKKAERDATKTTDEKKG